MKEILKKITAATMAMTLLCSGAALAACKDKNEDNATPQSQNSSVSEESSLVEESSSLEETSSTEETSSSTDEKEEVVVTRKPCPDFSVQLLKNENDEFAMGGETFEISKQLGKTVIIHFWTTWIATEEMQLIPQGFTPEIPLFNSLKEKHKEDVVVLNINLDKTSEELCAWLNESAPASGWNGYDMYFAQVDAAEDLWGKFDFEGEHFSSTVIVNTEGEIVYSQKYIMYSHVLNGVIDSLMQPKQCPDFTVNTLKCKNRYYSTDGATFDIKEQRGKVVVVNFWATWCGPCLNELPAFDKFQSEHKDDVVMLAINKETEKTAKQIANWLNDDSYKIGFADYSLTFAHYGANETDLYKLFGFADAIPATAIIDQEGNVVYFGLGGLSYEMLDGIISPLL